MLFKLVSRYFQEANFSRFCKVMYYSYIDLIISYSAEVPFGNVRRIMSLEDGTRPQQQIILVQIKESGEYQVLGPPSWLQFIQLASRLSAISQRDVYIYAFLWYSTQKYYCYHFSKQQLRYLHLSTIKSPVFPCGGTQGQKRREHYHSDWFSESQRLKKKLDGRSSVRDQHITFCKC